MPKLAVRGPVRRLAIVLGDQLDFDADAIKELDKSRDAILMMEVSEESTHVPSHKQPFAFMLIGCEKASESPVFPEPASDSG
jgi:deoxyribodipyrimidine photolyase-related protein